MKYHLTKRDTPALRPGETLMDALIRRNYEQARRTVEGMRRQNESTYPVMREMFKRGRGERGKRNVWGDIDGTDFYT